MPKSALEVTLTRVKGDEKIVEGTFAADAFDLAAKKTTITEGRFRLKVSEDAKELVYHRPPESAWLVPATNALAAMRYRTFNSKTIGRQVSYLLYLPPSYETDKDRRYPVVFWLHGMGGTPNHGAGFVRRLEKAILTNAVPELIAVVVNGMRNSVYCDSKDGRLPMETVLVKDLVPHIDSAYRTWARREGRAIEGSSMGGWGAARLGFKYPDTFGVVSILNGAMYTSIVPVVFHEIFGGDAKYFESESAWTWLEKNSEPLRRSHIRIWVGAQDRLLPGNRQLSEAMKRLNVDHEFGVAAGVEHNYGALVDSWNDGGWGFYRKAFASPANP